MKPIIRWTIGPTSKIGFLSLKLSISCMKKIFENSVDYAICYNNLNQHQLNMLPDVDILVNQHEYENIYNCESPIGPAWKLYPPRLRRESPEISMDNDLILYNRLQKIDDFMHGSFFMITEAYNWSYHGILKNFLPSDVKINSGFVCLPPDYDYQSEISRTIDQFQLGWQNHFSEQTLVAYVFFQKNYTLINLKEINVCANVLDFGQAGLHLVGINRNNSVASNDFIKSLRFI